MTEIEQSSDQTPAPRQKRGWLAAGGIIGAIVASSCCILPLVLVLAGVSGAWIGSLTALDPYKPYFIVVTPIQQHHPNRPLGRLGDRSARRNDRLVGPIFLLGDTQ